MLGFFPSFRNALYLNCHLQEKENTSAQVHQQASYFSVYEKSPPRWSPVPV